MRWTTTCALGLLTFALMACGADGGAATDGIASLGGGTTTTAGTPTGGGAAGGGADDRFYLFAKCMRDHGVDVPDPDPGGGPVRIGPGTGIDPENPRFQEAQQACAKEVGDLIPGGNDPARRQEFQDKALAFARCMRDNGIDMPDPTFGEGGRVEQRLEGGVSPDDPRFQEAQKQCESLRPFGREGGPAGATRALVPGGGSGS
jgi:hypothetical protein